MTTIRAELHYDEESKPYVVMDQAAAYEPDDFPATPLSDDEVREAAESDPDARPFTREDLTRIQPQIRPASVRHLLRLTQAEFADRFGIPLGTLRDWEQGRREPDMTARTLMRAISMDPDLIARAVDRDRVPSHTSEKTRKGAADRSVAK